MPNPEPGEVISLPESGAAHAAGGGEPLTLTFRAATAGDAPLAETLLRTCSLMGLDAGAQFGEPYVLAINQQGTLAGMAGLEVYGDAGLLRSVAVAPGERSRRLGGRLVQDRIEWARARGLAALYLLTNDGEAYFAPFGFRRVDRQEAPSAVAASWQWSSACPSSSIAMKLAL